MDGQATGVANWQYMIAIVAAYAKNRVIGKDNRIPWRLARDRVMLKRLTLGNTVILGRKSYDSMAWYYDQSGRPMPGKTYIVVTRNPDYKATRDNIRIAATPEEALRIAGELHEDAYVIGGEHIFTALLPYADRMYLGEIDADIEGDAYFPEPNPNEWTEVSREHFTADEKNEYDSDEVVLERKR